MNIDRQKLAACVNIHGEMRSVYEWNGAVLFKLETPLFVKTTAAAATARDEIISLHPDDEPCVVALPVLHEGSSTGYLDWTAKTTVS